MFWKKKTSLKKDLERLYKNAQKYGWQQNSYASSSKRPHAGVTWRDSEADTFCIVGLICRTRYEAGPRMKNFGEVVTDPMYGALHEAIPAGKDRYLTLAQYNDHRAKSKDDILRLIKTAIEMQG